MARELLHDEASQVSAGNLVRLLVACYYVELASSGVVGEHGRAHQHVVKAALRHGLLHSILIGQRAVQQYGQQQVLVQEITVAPAVARAHHRHSYQPAYTVLLHSFYHSLGSIFFQMRSQERHVAAKGIHYSLLPIYGLPYEAGIGGIAGYYAHTGRSVVVLGIVHKGRYRVASSQGLLYHLLASFAGRTNHQNVHRARKLKVLSCLRSAARVV